jgi:hypothetical protein
MVTCVSGHWVIGKRSSLEMRYRSLAFLRAPSQIFTLLREDKAASQDSREINEHHVSAESCVMPYQLVGKRAALYCTPNSSSIPRCKDLPVSVARVRCPGVTAH